VPVFKATPEETRKLFGKGLIVFGAKLPPSLEQRLKAEKEKAEDATPQAQADDEKPKD